MIYTLAAITVLQMVLTALLIIYIVEACRKDRKDLEDRLMAISQPVALIQHKAADADPGDVHYVDEQREYELQHTPGLNGDGS